MNAEWIKVSINARIIPIMSKEISKAVKIMCLYLNIIYTYLMNSSFMKPWRVYIVAKWVIILLSYFQPGYDHNAVTDTH